MSFGVATVNHILDNCPGLQAGVNVQYKTHQGFSPILITRKTNEEIGLKPEVYFILLYPGLKSGAIVRRILPEQ